VLCLSCLSLKETNIQWFSPCDSLTGECRLYPALRTNVLTCLGISEQLRISFCSYMHMQMCACVSVCVQIIVRVC